MSDTIINGNFADNEYNTEESIESFGFSGEEVAFSEEISSDEDMIFTDGDEASEDGEKGKPASYDTYEAGEKTAVLVSVFSKDEEEEARLSLAELERLVDTAGGTVLGTVTQVRDKPDGRTCIGSGKLEELSKLVASTGAQLCVFDTELSPVQIKLIENALGDGVSVIDRSMLILDIFASRARSAEGRLQVELALLQYTAPRLMGKGRDMSRLGGGIGTRGPGESKLEIDRRRLKARIHALESELERVEATRMTMRRARDRSGVSKCAVVGYTNAGKSTLLNTLTGAGIFAEDKLFATLDPTTRLFSLPNGEKVLLTDTVGFIRKLPHHLIKAFKSTLDEAVYADVLMIVCDASDPDLPSQMEVTRQTLEELGAAGKPTLIVFNKCDAVEDENVLLTLRSLAGDADEETVFISASTGEGCDKLGEILEKMLSAGKVRIKMNIPLSDGAAVSAAFSLLEDVTCEYTDTHTAVSALADAASAGRFRKYIENYEELFGLTEE